MFPSCQTVSHCLYNRYSSLLLDNKFPLNFSLQVSSNPCVGVSILLSFHQSHIGGDIKIWTSVIQSDPDISALPQEGAHYYFCREYNYRALVKSSLCQDEEHFRHWFQRAVSRVYQRRVCDLVSQKDVSVGLIQWKQDSEDLLF